jgi:hypothetical protein
MQAVSCKRNRPESKDQTPRRELADSDLRRNLSRWFGGRPGTDLLYTESTTAIAGPHHGVAPISDIEKKTVLVKESWWPGTPTLG